MTYATHYLYFMRLYIIDDVVIMMMNTTHYLYFNCYVVIYDVVIIVMNVIVKVIMLY